MLGCIDGTAGEGKPWGILLDSAILHCWDYRNIAATSVPESIQDAFQAIWEEGHEYPSANWINQRPQIFL